MIHGELLGPKIQSNLYDLSDFKFFVFDICNKTDNVFWRQEVVDHYAKEFGFESKKGSGKDGYPDFFLDNEDFVVIVEAKTSKQKDAESDVLFYMEHNKIDKDMLGIAVSGQTLEDLQVSYFKK